MTNYTDQDLISNVYRAGTEGCDIGTDAIWSVCVNSPMVLSTIITVHAKNVTTAKRIAREYAWRVLEIPVPTAPTAERL
jgi:hypothetical protein